MYRCKISDEDQINDDIIILCPLFFYRLEGIDFIFVLKFNMSVTSALDLTKLEHLDNELSKRFIELDPSGYFVIYIDREAGLICAKHYTNNINEEGLAVDPDTGEVIACRGSKPRSETQLFTGRTAKEICVKLFEQTLPIPVSKFDHACYLGREFMRAEYALKTGQDYLQD